MKTYAESQGKRAFNWNKFLDKKKFSSKELYAAKLRAKSWVTCACGNQCSILDRDENDGEPRDIELAALGREFYQKIIKMHSANNMMNRISSGNNYYRAQLKVNRISAIRFLKKIEKRSAVVIKEELKSLGKRATLYGFKLLKVKK